MAGAQLMLACPRCKTSKSEDKFYQHKSRPSGRACWCIACTEESKLKSRTKSPKPCRRCKQLSPQLYGVLCGKCHDEQATDSKTCTKCKRHQPLSEFHKSKSYVLPVCRTCRNRHNREYKGTPKGKAMLFEIYKRSHPTKKCERCEQVLSRDKYRTRTDRICTDCRSFDDQGLKRCSRCRNYKLRSQFPGQSYYCNDCNNAIAKTIQGTPERILWMKKYNARQNVKEKRKECQKRRRQDPIAKEKMKASARRNRHKRMAHRAVCLAAAGGLIQKAKSLPCNVCGAPAKEYHHHKGYERKHWFSIIPVCYDCHGTLNGEQRRAGLL